MNSEHFSDWLESMSQSLSNRACKKPLIMGIVNITEDSFSDGGAFLSPKKACAHALTLIEQGADIIDIGGESSRPGAHKIPVETELNRVIPVIKYIRAHSDVCISVDTYKPEVMFEAVKAGANIINDIYALQFPGALDAAKELEVTVCLMHMQGEPHTMQLNPQYPQGLMTQLQAFFQERIEACDKAGINKNKLILDPGIGFGKRLEDNLRILRCLEEFHSFNIPLLIGVSRKSMIGAILNKAVDERLIGGIALAVYATMQGVGIIRTHDVDETNQAVNLINKVRQDESA